VSDMYPLTFLQRLRKYGVPENSTVELFHIYSEKHIKLMQAENYINTLTEDNKRLKYENEFMLKLVNSHIKPLDE